MADPDYYKLYKALKADGAVQGDWASFHQYVGAKGKQGYENRLNLYKALKADGAIQSKSYEEFQTKLYNGGQQNLKAAKQHQEPQTAAQKALQMINSDEPVVDYVRRPAENNTVAQQSKTLKGPGKNASALVRGLYQQDDEQRALDRVPYTQKAKGGDSAFVQNKKANDKVTDTFMKDGAPKTLVRDTMNDRPMVDTGYEGANMYVTKTRNQFADEISQSGRSIVDGSKEADDFVESMVNNEVFKADKRYRDILKNGAGVGSYMSYGMNVKPAFQGLANKEVDDETMLKNLEKGLTDSVMNYISNPNVAEQIRTESKRLGVDPMEYVKEAVAPALYEKMAQRLPGETLKKYLPQSKLEYILDGINDSAFGTLTLFDRTEGQRKKRQEATEMTREGYNPNLQVGAWDNAGRGAVSFAADTPVFGPAGTVAGKAVGLVFGSVGKQAVRAASQTLFERIGTGVVRGVVHGGVTGFQYGAVNNVIQNYSTGEDTSLGGTLKAALNGGVSEAVSFATMEGMGGVVGAFGRGMGLTGAERTFGQAAKGIGKKLTFETVKTGMEGLGMATGGVASDKVASWIEGRDSHGFTTEGTLESCASAVIFKLMHAKEAFKSHGGGKDESGNVGKRYLDKVKSNLYGMFLSENARSELSGNVFSKSEMWQLRNAGEKAGMDVSGTFVGFADKTKKPAQQGDGSKEAATYYQAIMNDPTISWDTKAKFTTMVMGTMPSARPMADFVTFTTEKLGGNEAGYEKYINVYSADGELLSKTSYDSISERRAKEYEIRAKRADQAMWNALGVIVGQDMNETNLQNGFFKKQLEENVYYEDDVDSLVYGMGQQGSEEYNAYREYVTQNGRMASLLQSVAERHGLTVEDVYKALQKEPMKRTDSEQKAMVDLRKTAIDAAFPNDKVHEEQSRQDGKDVAEENGLGTDRPNQQAVTQELDNLKQAEAELEAMMQSDDTFAENFKNLQGQGLTTPQIYEWMVNNGLTEEQLAPFARYINAVSRVQGMQKATSQAIEQHVQAFVTDWTYHGEMNGEKLEGDSALWVKDKDGRALLVGSGDVSYDPNDGHCKDGDMLVCFDPNTGEVAYVKASDTTLMQTQTKDELAADERRRIENINNAPYQQAAQEQAAEEAARAQQQGENTTATQPGTDGRTGQEQAPQDAAGGTGPAQQQETKPTRKFSDGSDVPMTKDRKGRDVPDYDNMTAEQAAELLSQDFGESAEKVAEGMVSKANKELEKAKKMKVDYEGDINDIKEQEGARKKAIDAAKKKTEHADNIRKALGAKEVRKAFEANNEPVDGANKADPAVKKRYDDSKKITGRKGSITLANGQKIKGTYVYGETSGLTPSHDPTNNFAQSEGFPVNADGTSANSRSYKDANARAFTIGIGNGFNGLALQNVPVVQDGVVLSGNGTTMAKKLAEQNGKDGKYYEALAENAVSFGLDAGDIEKAGFKGLVYFVPDEKLPLTSDTFDIFNKRTEKNESNKDMAVKMAKTLSPEDVGAIIAEIEGKDGSGTLEAFFNNPSAINGLVRTLVKKGVIGQNDVSALMEGGKRLSPQGREFVKNLLLGSVFSPETIEMMGEGSSLKDRVVKAIRPVLRNLKLGDYSLMDEINEAVRLMSEARTSDMTVDNLLRQGDFVKGNARDRYPSISQLMALTLEGNVDDFRNLLDDYNRQAAARNTGEADVFGDAPTKEELIKEFLDYKNWIDYDKRGKDPEGEGGNDLQGPEGPQPDAPGDDGEGRPLGGGNPPAGGEEQKKVREVLKALAKDITERAVGAADVVTDEKEIERIYEALGGNVKRQRSDEIDKKYPNWLEGTTNDNGKHSTQVAGTIGTYKKVASWIEKNLGKSVRILDASSGMGLGTQELRKQGFNIEDVEPYQSEDRKKENPATYSSYNDISGDYDVIISNAVLNVIPDDWRSNVLHDMASRLKVGGRLFINTRKAGEEKSIKDKIELDSPQEVLVKRNGKIASYQRFFTPKELRDWVQKELGYGYEVEVANEKNSGTKGLAAVVVTKKASIREFRTKDGEVYGFTDGKKIYLDLKKMKPETPLHEYGHLWAEALRRLNPNEWENVKGLFDQVEGLKEEIQKAYPELEGDDLYEEMITTYSGRKGAEKLEAEARRIAAEEGKKMEDSAKAKGFVDKVRDALKRYWKGIADLLHIKFTNADEVADKMLADWADGVDPRKLEGTSGGVGSDQAKGNEGSSGGHNAGGEGPSEPAGDLVGGLHNAALGYKRGQGQKVGQSVEQTPEEKAAAREKEMQEHPLTTEEIDSYDTGDADADAFAKEYAKDYLAGKVTPMTALYYNEIYDHVRNTRQDSKGDSGTADTAHVDGGSDDSGEPGGGGKPTEPVDKGTGEGDVSGGGQDAGTDGPERPASADGGSGNQPVGGEAPKMDGVSDSTRRRGRGRKSGGKNGADGQQPSQGNGGGAGEAKTDAQAAYEQSGQKVNDILSKIKALRNKAKNEDRGKLNAYPGLVSAVVGELAKKMLPRSREEFKLYGQLMSACIEHAYNGLKLYSEKATKWFEGINGDLHDAIKDTYGESLTDEDVDNYIKSLWNENYTLNGKRQTIEKWAAEIGQEKLREALRKPIKEKRKAQQEAEGVAVKIGDADNIAETLPFLLPEQQNDVLKAENRFFGKTDENGKKGETGIGMLFTNGTGTGKTYTGLGIAKRFIKQGKGRVLIVTPSQEKVTDWTEDAKNLGITLNALKQQNGKGATADKGEGAVITTFANFRANKALLEDTFDLVIYDESHKLMENKDATESSTTKAHYKMTNKDFFSAKARLTESHPLWREETELMKEQQKLMKGNPDYESAVLDRSIPDSDIKRIEDIEKRLGDIRKEQQKVMPEIDKAARESVGKTKVVFLSATPFNMRENIEYAEGYLFHYGDGKMPDTDSMEQYQEMRRNAKNAFFRQWFPHGEEIGSNGKIRPNVTDADKNDEEERKFADHLMEMGVMSGRTIDNGYDYSRDFPTVSVSHANAFNTALREMTQNGALQKFANSVFGDYNTMSVVYETMKVSAIAQRLKDHMGMGRKIVVFHRRVNDNKGLARPPFAAALKKALDFADVISKGGQAQDKATAQSIKEEVARFAAKHADLLEWEQSLDYRMPRQQLRSLLGDTHNYTPEEMARYNKSRQETIDKVFSGESDLPPYEAGRKFGEACFDIEDADVVDEYKPHRITDEEAETLGIKPMSKTAYDKLYKGYKQKADEVRRGIEDNIKERIAKGELKIELDEKGKRKRRAGLFAGDDSKSQKHDDVTKFNDDDSGMDIIVVQEASGKEGLSLQDKTGKHQRVMVNLALPQSPIAFIQAEGRIYRIGQASNAIFEYPLLGIDNEIQLFAGRFNGRAATTENLALGSMARGLKDAITRGVLAKSGKVPLESQGLGGKEWDMRDDQRKDGYESAVSDYQSNSSHTDQTIPIDGSATPEPLGYKMVEWAGMTEGESTLEPSAGTGSISRYIPSNVSSLSIEPDVNRRNTLMLLTGAVERGTQEAQGRRTQVSGGTFEDLNGVNKFDTIVMNSPNGADNALAKHHLEKAFVHLNDSGRLVAVLPRTEDMSRFVNGLTDGNPSLHLSATIVLPDCAFSKGGVSQKSVVVVVDKLNRDALRKEWKETAKIDLSDAADMEGFFKELKNVKVPDRVIDPAAKYIKHGNVAAAKIKNLEVFKSRGGKVYQNDEGIWFYPVNKFREALRFGFSLKDGYGYTKRFSPMSYNSFYYKNIKELTMDVLNTYHMCKEVSGMTDEQIADNCFYKSDAGNKLSVYVDNMRQYCESVAKMIRGVSGRTDAQLERAFNGEDIDNAVTMSVGTKLTMKDVRSVFDENNSDAELGGLFDKVYDVAKDLGMDVSVYSDENSRTSAYYSNENALRINARFWNAKKLVDGKGRVINMTNQLRAEVLTHELIHSVTAYANYWNKEDPSRLTPELREAADELDAVYKAVVNSPEAYRLPSYCKENVNELVAESANHEVRDVLKKMGLWTRLVNAVKRFFTKSRKSDAIYYDGMNEEDFESSTAYNELSKILDKYLNNFSKDAYDAYVAMSGRRGEEKLFDVVGDDGRKLPTVWIPKDEYAKLSSAINTNHRFGEGETGYEYTDNNFYIYTNRGDGMFDVNVHVPIDGNEGLIEILKERVENETLRSTGDIASAFEANRHGSNWYYNDNAFAKRRRGIDVGSGRISLLRQGNGESGDEHLAPELHSGTPANPKGSTEGGINHFRTDNTPSIVNENASEVEKHAYGIAEKLGGSVDVVRSADEVTDAAVKERLARGENVTGWYDGKTGKVYLYLPNVHDRYTAEKTIWHETVGHKGMRGLVGDENYRKFLRGVWYGLDEPGNERLKELVEEEMRYNPLDYESAVEEGIARMAEEGRGEPGLWNRLKQKVTDLLHEVGYRIAPNTKDVKYLLWLAKNRQKHPNDLTWKMREEALRYRLEKDDTPSVHVENGLMRTNDGRTGRLDELTRKEYDEATDGEIHFRTSPSTATALDRYHNALKSHGYMFTESFMDNMASLKELMKAMEPGTKDVADIKSSENAYILQNTMQGAMSDKADRFERDVMAPLDKAMAGVLDAFEGKNDDEKVRNFNLYMITKHGLERNRVLFVRDNVNELRKDDATKDDADLLQEQWNAEKKDLGERLRRGQLTLDEYYSEMDEWIRNNVDATYKAGEHDYSGMHALQGIGKDKDPYDDASAVASVMDNEASMESQKKGSVNDFWDKVQNATRFSIQSDYDNGLISKELKEHVDGMFDWYVPLRKYDEKTAEDTYGYITEKGDPKNYIGGTLMKAKGHKYLSEANVLAMIGAMGNRAISNGGMNAVKQAFARFVRSHPDSGLVTETSVWYVEDPQTKTVTERYPDIPEDATPDEVSKIVKDFNDEMQKLKAQGLAKKVNRSGRIGYRFEKKADKSQHLVDVMIAGRKHTFVVNGNPRAAQALNGLLENDGKKNFATKSLSKVTRFMAQMCTSFNPEFTLRNILRDAEFASSNIAAKEGSAYTGKWMEYYTKYMGKGFMNTSMKDFSGTTGLGLYNKYRNGTLDVNDKTQKYFKEFMENGGETGWVQILNFDDWKKKYKEDIGKERSKTKKAGNIIRDFLLGNIENMNEVAENAARFATYCASRESGRSKVRSAYDAKEVSTNFNRHGSGSAIKSFKHGDESTVKKDIKGTYGFVSSYLRNYSMFFNAGIQSTNLLKNNLKNNPVGTITAMMSVPFGLGLLSAAVNNMLISSEDEDERNGVKDPCGELPGYIRRNNLCIYTGKGQFVTIPLAIELRAFYGLGDIAAGLTFSPNVKGTNPVYLDAAGCLSQLVPVMDFLNGSSDDTGKEALKAIAPTSFVPFMEWALNSDWKGMPIERRGDWNENAPAWQRAYSDTPEGLIELNKKVNAMTNDVAEGNENMKGNDVLDAMTNPSALNHFYDSYGSGALTFGGRFIGLLKKGKDTEMSKIPFMRSFYYKPNERTSLQRTKSRWYSYKADMEKTIDNVSRLKRKNVPVVERMRNLADLNRFRQSADAEKVNIIEATDKQLKRWNKLRDMATDDDSRKNANDNIDRIIKDAVDKLDRLSEKP